MGNRHDFTALACHPEIHLISARLHGHRYGVVHAALAQLVEHRIRNAGVTGSSPVSGTSPQKSAQNQQFMPRSRPDCSPQLSPTVVPDHMVRTSDHSTISEANCGPKVSPKRVSCGLWRRGAIYQYRTRVPADLIEIVGKTRINRSLQTASLTIARRLVRVTAYEIEMQFEGLRGRGKDERAGVSNQAVNTSPEKVSSLVCPIRPAPDSLTLADACERYLTDPTISRTAKSTIVYRSTFATITGILGGNMPFASISRDACRGVLTVLQRLPPNARKRWLGLSPIEVAAQAEKRGDPPMSIANINEYMNKAVELV